MNKKKKVNGRKEEGKLKKIILHVKTIQDIKSIEGIKHIKSNIRLDNFLKKSFGIYTIKT